MSARLAILGALALFSALIAAGDAAAQSRPVVEARKVAGLAAPAEIRIDR